MNNILYYQRSRNLKLFWLFAPNVCTTNMYRYFKRFGFGAKDKVSNFQLWGLFQISAKAFLVETYSSSCQSGLLWTLKVKKKPAAAITKQSFTRTSLERSDFFNGFFFFLKKKYVCVWSKKLYCDHRRALRQTSGIIII